MLLFRSPTARAADAQRICEPIVAPIILRALLAVTVAVGLGCLAERLRAIWTRRLLARLLAVGERLEVVCIAARALVGERLASAQVVEESLLADVVARRRCTALGLRLVAR